MVSFRRQIYNEMKQAAERNRRAVRGDYDTPQPAAPAPARPSQEGHLSPAAPSPPLSREPSPSPRQPSGGLGVDPTAEERYSVAAAHCHAVSLLHFLVLVLLLLLLQFLTLLFFLSFFSDSSASSTGIWQELSQTRSAISVALGIPGNNMKTSECFGKKGV